MSRSGTSVKFCHAGVLRQDGGARRNASRRCGMPIADFSTTRQHLSSEWKSFRQSTPLITASLSKIGGIRPNRGGGKSMPPERASRSGNLNFLKRCPKRPAQARWHWLNCGPPQQTDDRCGRHIASHCDGDSTTERTAHRCLTRQFQGYSFRRSRR